MYDHRSMIRDDDHGSTVRDDDHGSRVSNDDYKSAWKCFSDEEVIREAMHHIAWRR